MNLFIGAGRLTRNAIVNGTEHKALKFTIAAGNNNKNNGKEKVDFVPCVLFRPSQEIEQFLVEQGKGALVKFEGKVATSRFEADGKTRYSTEVIVNNTTFSMQQA